VYTQFRVYVCCEGKNRKEDWGQEGMAGVQYSVVRLRKLWQCCWSSIASKTDMYDFGRRRTVETGDSIVPLFPLSLSSL
jgi:hypothetical protein